MFVFKDIRGRAQPSFLAISQKNGNNQLLSFKDPRQSLYDNVLGLTKIRLIATEKYCAIIVFKISRHMRTQSIS